MPYDLQEAQVKIFSQTECKNTLGSTVSDGHVCAGESAAICNVSDLT